MRMCIWKLTLQSSILFIIMIRMAINVTGNAYFVMSSKKTNGSL